MIIHLKNQRKTRMMKRTRTAIWWKVTGPSSSFFFCKTSRIAFLSPNLIGFLGGNKLSMLKWIFHNQLILILLSWSQDEFKIIIWVQDVQPPLAGKAKEEDLEPKPADEQVDKDGGQGKGHPAECQIRSSWKQKIPPGKVERGAGPKKGAHHPLQHQVRSCAGQGSHLDGFTLESLLLKTIFRNEIEIDHLSLCWKWNKIEHKPLQCLQHRQQRDREALGFSSHSP